MCTWARRSYPCHLFVEEAWRVKSNTSFRASLSLSQHTNISAGIVNISHFPLIYSVCWIYVCRVMPWGACDHISTYSGMDCTCCQLIDVKQSSFYTQTHTSEYTCSCKQRIMHDTLNYVLLHTWFYGFFLFSWKAARCLWCSWICCP